MNVPWIGTHCEHRGCPSFGREHEHTRKATPHPAEERVLDDLVILTDRYNDPLLAAQTLFGGTR